MHIDTYLASRTCKSISCNHPILDKAADFCEGCAQTAPFGLVADATDESSEMARRYPKYYKDVSAIDSLDVYAVHQLFDIQDPSGALQHASKKLLLSGVRTGGKSQFKDIKEARDTLTRWLQLNPEH